MSDVYAVQSFHSSGRVDTVYRSRPTVVDMKGEPLNDVDDKATTRNRGEKQLDAAFNPSPLTAIRKHGPEGFALEITLPRVAMPERENLIRDSLVPEKTSMKARAYAVQVLLDPSLEFTPKFVAEMVDVATKDPSWRVRREAQRTKKQLDGA